MHTYAFRTFYILLLGVAACSRGSDTAITGDCTPRCATGLVCLGGTCVTELVDAGQDAARDASPAIDTGPVSTGTCTSGTPCQNDSFCAADVCVQWDPGNFDPGCVREGTTGSVRASVQCEWLMGASDDPAPSYHNVMATPVVANLGIELGPDVPKRPSIVFASDPDYPSESYNESGGCHSRAVLRVVDGATCDLQGVAAAEEDRVEWPVAPAIGDLDGDGHPEIVTAAAEGGLIAFRWDPIVRNIVRLWRSRTSEGAVDTSRSSCVWGAVTMADLDNDAAPEIIFDGKVYASDGLLLAASIPGFVHAGDGHGAAPVLVADVDLDGEPELVSGEGTWRWDSGLHTFTMESYVHEGLGTAGIAAVADFGDFPEFDGDAPGRPEVVVVHYGQIHLQTIAGTEIASTPPGVHVGNGGAPTIADFDGDGKPEVGAAFGDAYTVWDPLDGVTLWSVPSQDRSSGVTGSSVFDFNADGRSEVVYHDECFLRVYDGTTGEVIFSQGSFTPTAFENPVIADVDGDSAAEIVSAAAWSCMPSYCPAVDPVFKGLRCEVDDDCVSGSCDTGYCRCTSDDACGHGYACRAPGAGVGGSGNVCLAAFGDCHGGITVYRDAHDLWAPSRGIWNQHAYSVTNVNDDGTIPRSSEVQNNWEVAGLNNFRQNVQGVSGGSIPGGDLTTRELTANCLDGGQTRISASVCNRGGALIDSGVTIIFNQMGDGTELCRLTTTEPVPAGACTPVECVANVLAEGVFEAVVDPDRVVLECKEDNNGASGIANCLN